MSESSTISAKVPFNAIIVSRCKCPQCAVQLKSKCFSEKLAVITEDLGKKSMGREDIPGVYCSTGTASCADLDPEATCMCESCGVFIKCKLTGGTPAGHFCLQGFAA